MGSIQYPALSRTPAPGSSKERMDPRLPAATLEEAEVDPTMKVINFTTVGDVFREVDCAKGDVLLVQRVSPEIFKQLEEEREIRGRKFRFNLYTKDSQCLMITIPTRPHEQLYVGLYEEVLHSVKNMGLRRSWRSLAASAFSKEGPYYGSGGGGGSGEGDASGGPMPERDYPGSFPTIVIEGGYSSSLAQLRQKARFWFDISNHDVKIVLLAKLHLAQRKIILERWEERQRAGATTTRRGSEWVASCHQEITITKSSTSPSAYDVTSGDLVLSFRQLFLRNPRAGESDIVIPVAELQWYAAEVWAEVRNEAS